MKRTAAIAAIILPACVILVAGMTRQPAPAASLVVLPEKEERVVPAPAQVQRYIGFDPDTDYLSVMVDCCLRGDLEAGEEAARQRNLKIDTLELDEVKVDFTDLYLLAKIITAEAGSSWLPAEWKMMVGEVLLNRVASPEFPDTIEECVYQRGQYSGTSNGYFDRLTPFEDCVRIAVRLLEGERILNDPSVVFQANFRQGSGVHTTLYDEILGYTYLCHSNNPHLYEGGVSNGIHQEH